MVNIPSTFISRFIIPIGGAGIVLPRSLMMVGQMALPDRPCVWKKPWIWPTGWKTLTFRMSS